MCGIIGYFYLDGRPLSEQEDMPVLRRMADAIEYRGPDDRQFLLWENVGIAFNRLSIVDVDGGRQPIETRDGRVSAVVNGELYNHRELRGKLTQHPLSSQSDCEIVPYLYLEHGVHLFDEVNGMFAAALVDRRERRLLLARDRVGIKPLFYCRLPESNLVVFASELKALLAHPAVPRRFDWLGAMTKGLNAGVPGRHLPSNFVGIERVPPATVLDFSLTDGSMRQHTYWRLPAQPDESSGRSARDYAEEYRDLLRESVRKRLMSDVPFGVFLSGGIDSAMVAALAAENATFPTFSVLSQSTVANGDAGGADATARHLGLPNHQVYFDLPRLELEPDDWRRLLWHCELIETSAEQLHKFYLHAFAKRMYPDLKVMLLGQGSDEFTGGYIEWVIGGKPPWGPHAWSEVDEVLRARLAGTYAFTSGIAMSYGDLVQRGVVSAPFLFERAGALADVDTWRLYNRYWSQNLDAHLWHEDRTSSAHSIESRVPFLDHGLLEFLARIPREHHAELFTDKKILRLAAQGVAPNEVIDRPKGYFFFGEGEEHTFHMLFGLLKKDGGALVDEAIQGSDLTGGPLDGPQLRKLIGEVERNPTRDATAQIVSLVNMGLLANMAIHPPR